MHSFCLCSAPKQITKEMNVSINRSSFFFSLSDPHMTTVTILLPSDSVSFPNFRDINNVWWDTDWDKLEGVNDLA